MPDLEARLAELAAELDRNITRVTAGFESSLVPMVLKAQGRLLVTLTDQLATEDGEILMTPANQQAIRRIDKLFAEYMRDEGYPELVDAYVKQFDGNLPMFQEVMGTLREAMKTPVPEVRFTAKDLRVFDAFKLSTALTIDSVIEGVGDQAVRQALFSINGLSFRQLTQTLATQLGRTTAEASTIAATGMATHYRTVAARGYEIVEEESAEPLRYVYDGPLDKLTRPFCRRMLTGKKAYTRKQIDGMNNGTRLSNVFLNCGGWNCRHQWRLWIPEDQRIEAA